MKTGYLFSFASMFMLLSCAKAAEEPIPEGHSNILSIRAVHESISNGGVKTSITSDLNVYWIKTDKLYVFDSEGTPVSFQTTDDFKEQVSFSTDTWTGKTATYACLAPMSIEETACTSDGVITVKVSDAQSISAPKKYGIKAGVSVGRISGDRVNYSIESMKNVTGFVKLSLLETQVTSITVKPVAGDEIIAGYVDVNYAKLVDGKPDFWIPTPGREQFKSVTVTPAEDSKAITEDGTFVADSYYVPVLSGFYSKGLACTITYKDGSTLTKTVGEDGITVNRSDISTVEDALDDTFPKDIDIVIAFYNEKNEFPFTYDATGAHAIAPASAQTEEGENYTYEWKYMVGDREFSLNLPFVICKGPGGNYAFSRYTVDVPGSYTSYNCFTNGAKEYGWIKLPAINGRRLSSIKVVYGNISKKQMVLRETPTSTPVAEVLWQGATSDAPCTQYFLTGVAPDRRAPGLKAGTPYYIFFGNSSTQNAGRGGNIRIYELELKYQK